MEIDPVEPSQWQDSEGNMTAAVEAIVKQVEVVEKQVAMIAGPSPSHKKHRVLKEPLQSCEVPPQPRPSTIPSSSSHGLNKAASAVARQGEPLGAAAEEPAAVGSPSSARGDKRKNTLMFSLSLPQYHSLVIRAQEFTFSVQRWPPLFRDDIPDDVS